MVFCHLHSSLYFWFMSLFSSLLGINDIWFYGISSSWGINDIRQVLFFELWDNYKLCQYLVLGLVEKKLLFKFGIRAVKRQCDFMGWDIQMCVFFFFVFFGNQ